MSPPVHAVPGAVVAWWRGGDLSVAVVAGEEKQRVVLVGPAGREDRVPASRLAFTVEPQGPPPGRSAESRRAAGDRATLAEARLRDRARRVEVPALWEISRETGGLADEALLADLALGDGSGEARASVVRALLDDSLHFVRKPEGWEPRSPESVAEIRAQRDREARRAEERRAAIAALARAASGGGWSASGSESERRLLGILEETAVLRHDAPFEALDAARRLLDEVGLEHDRPFDGAFRLLRLCGRFDGDDANLEIVRYGLRTSFPDEVVAAAAGAAARGFDRSRRADLTGLETVTIDAAHTCEVDDALSVEPLGGGRRRVGIHISAPDAFVAAGDPVDSEALSRGVSHYFPDARLPMLPPSISEQAASLVVGIDRPALSFLVEVGSDGAVLAYDVVRSIVRVTTRHDYDGVDRMLAAGEGGGDRLVRELDDVGALREASRIASGAIALRSHEVEARVLGDGTLALDRRNPDSRAQRLVSEAMILAGEVAARFASERGLALLHRRQPPPVPPLLPERIADAARDLVAARALRRSLRRSEVSIVPGPHWALGLPAYAQATSPIRRFQDLANHRQIVTWIEREEPAYDAEALRRIAATTERAEAQARRAERAADRYWLLKWIERGTGGPVDGTVVETSPRPVVLLHETLLEEPVPALEGAVVGAVVRLRVERVRPRADLLILRPA